MKQELGVISISEYNSLIEGSKKIVDNRINLNLLVLKMLPFISLVLFLIGCGLIFIGFKNWKKKQDDIDESDEIKLEILRASKQLDLEEIDEKAENEVKEEFNEKKFSANNTSNETEIEQPNLEKLKSNLIGMEKLFFDKIVEFNSFIYEPKANLKIDDKYEIDIALNAINKQKYSDKLIEIKYLQTKLNMDIIKKSFSALVRVQNHIYKATNKRPAIILILVYSSDIVSSGNEISRFKSGVKEYLSQFGVGQFQYFILNNKEAENFQVTNIMK